jgi:predicted DNA repair protein MutK
MASGLAALLDDVAAIAKIAAASLDDVGAAAGKAGSKAMGVVVDDTAVTPGYAMGFSPDRELPIVGKIALGSLVNKFLILLPGALLLSAFAPWLVTPLLMLGGAYLCFEAAEKVLEKLHGDHPEAHPEELAQASPDMEREKVKGAIRTDFILSAEIMAIALNEVGDRPLALQAAALAVVALAITVGVYGTVALIVKMDDIGLNLSRRRVASAQALGRGLVKSMPVVLSGLSAVGTVAMLWVGGGIIVHGLEAYHLTPIPGWVHGAAEAVAHALPGGLGAAAGWVVNAALAGVLGLVLGGAIAGALHLVKRRKH